MLKNTLTEKEKQASLPIKKAEEPSSPPPPAASPLSPPPGFAEDPHTVIASFLQTFTGSPPQKPRAERAQGFTSPGTVVKPQRRKRSNAHSISKLPPQSFSTTSPEPETFTTTDLILHQNNTADTNTAKSPPLKNTHSISPLTTLPFFTTLSNSDDTPPKVKTKSYLDPLPIVDQNTINQLLSYVVYEQHSAITQMLDKTPTLIFSRGSVRDLKQQILKDISPLHCALRMADYYTAAIIIKYAPADFVQQQFAVFEDKQFEQKYGKNFQLGCLLNAYKTHIVTYSQSKEQVTSEKSISQTMQQIANEQAQAPQYVLFELLRHAIDPVHRPGNIQMLSVDEKNPFEAHWEELIEKLAYSDQAALGKDFIVSSRGAFQSFIINESDANADFQILMDLQQKQQTRYTEFKTRCLKIMEESLPKSLHP